MEKTRVVHIAQGVDFLGQNVRKYQGKLLIKPAKANVKAFLAKVRRIIKTNKGASAGNLIMQLIPVVRGWALCHHHVVRRRSTLSMTRPCRRCGSGLVGDMGRKAVDGSRRSTPIRTWTFVGTTSDDQGHTRLHDLVYAVDMPIVCHVKIQRSAHHYDLTWELYFEQRLGVKMAAHLRGRRQLLSLWKQQNGTCPVCWQRLSVLGVA